MIRILTSSVTLLALLSTGGPASACSCVVDRDQMKQRVEAVAGADLVFRGRPVRQMVLRPEQWRCDFDERSLESRRPPHGCMMIATYGANCSLIFGVKVTINRELVPDIKDRVATRTAWSKEPGLAQACHLPAGKYRVTATTGRQTESRIVLFNAKDPAPVSIALGEYQPLRYRTTFVVDSVEKGEVAKTLDIFTSQNDGSCGFGPFERGAAYEVFAARTKDGSYSVTLCGGTHQLKERKGG